MDGGRMMWRGEQRALWTAAVRPAVAAGIALFAACRTKIGIAELDRMLRKTEVQTIVLAESYSLFVPYGFLSTREYVKLIDEELRAQEKLFGLAPKPPIPIWLYPVQGLKGNVEPRDGGLTVLAPKAHPNHGIEGYANDSVIVLYVEREKRIPMADGKFLTGSFAAESYRATLRHELAHVWSDRAGMSGACWFNEGLAEYVEWMMLEDGVLARQHDNELLRIAASLPREQCTIQRCLDWTEDLPRIQSGAEPADLAARVASGAFVHFMMSRVAGDTFLERARTLRSLSRDELVAHEDEWQAWRVARAQPPS